MKPESEVEQEVKMRARFFGCTLFRNNSGACKDESGRVVRFGLGNTSPNQQFASSDEIGITEVVITPDMVGKTIGVFTAIEVKKEGWNPNKKFDAHEEKQNNFLQFVKSKGGIAGFANSVDSLEEIFRR